MTKFNLYTKERRLARKQFYHSSLWRKTRARQLKLYPLCEHCQRDFHKVTLATQVDHVHGWNDWDEFLKGPFESLCRDCHNRKTWMYDVPGMIKKEKTGIRLQEL